ncbi:MAG: histidine--tRNA ligase [Alphaproteobacteria bacterium]
MAKKEKKAPKPKAVLPKGFRDIAPDYAVRRRAAIQTLSDVYEMYGFEPLETPAIEYVEALGKFLPDVDRPEGGVFAFQDEDESWLALRYDLTAPLARFYAQNFQQLPKPYRRYGVGPVYRNEKPGPGRFREFYQFDADTVGSPLMAAEAELMAMAATGLEALGIARSNYVLKVNNRKVLTGVMELIGLSGEDAQSAERCLIVLRAMDKLDRLGADGVRELLGKGRMDASGDYTDGANLADGEADQVMAFMQAGGLDDLAALVNGNETGSQGVDELKEIMDLLAAQGIGADQAQIDPSIVRGLAYYTGPVFEAELTIETLDEKGKPRRFGAIGGGGRYDDLVKRFTGQAVPATGMSIGLDRLLSALPEQANVWRAPVVVTAMDNDRMGDYQAMVSELRNAGIKAELYIGGSAMKAQLKYADKRGAPCVVIAGSDEFERGEVTIKDLVVGAELAKDVADRAEWVAAEGAQQTVARADLVSAVRAILGRHHG